MAPRDELGDSMNCDALLEDLLQDAGAESQSRPIAIKEKLPLKSAQSKDLTLGASARGGCTPSDSRTSSKSSCEDELGSTPSSPSALRQKMLQQRQRALQKQRSLNSAGPCSFPGGVLMAENKMMLSFRSTTPGTESTCTSRPSSAGRETRCSSVSANDEAEDVPFEASGSMMEMIKSRMSLDAQEAELWSNKDETPCRKLTFCEENKEEQALRRRTLEKKLTEKGLSAEFNPDDAQSKSHNAGEFYITLKRIDASQRIGIDLHHQTGLQALQVASLSQSTDKTLIREWNATNSDRAVRVGDCIVEVNGQRGSTDALISAIKGMGQLRILVVRRPEKFRVEIYKASENSPIGIQFASKDFPKLMVSEVITDGLLADWNREHPLHEVRAGDQVISVNGKEGNAEDLLSLLKKEKKISIVAQTPHSKAKPIDNTRFGHAWL